MTGRYVDDDIEVRESTTDGLGVFARRPLALGQLIRVVNVVREVTDDAPLRPEAGERAEHCAHPAGRVVLYGDPDRHYNHSCDPNAWVRYRGGHPEIVARRDIPVGEEIRVDYLINNSGGDSWRCQCGVARCRGLTSVSFFTLPAAFQREYLSLLADWFVERHADEVAVLRARLGA